MRVLQTIKTFYMSKKKIILPILTLAIFGIAGFGYSEYNRKVKNLQNVNPAFVMNATELISAFEKNEMTANVNYLDKVIALKGTVKAIEKTVSGHYSVILGTQNSMSSARCSMDSTHQQDVASVKPGSVITIKGACTGFNADELLGSDVVLNRCVLEK